MDEFTQDLRGYGYVTWRISCRRCLYQYDDCYREGQQVDAWLCPKCWFELSVEQGPPIPFSDREGVA